MWNERRCDAEEEGLWCFGRVNRNVPFDGPVFVFLCFFKPLSAGAWRVETSHQGHDQL